MNIYKEIRNYLNEIPVVETHEHYYGQTQAINDPFKLFNGYDFADLVSSKPGMQHEGDVMMAIHDQNAPFEKRYEKFISAYNRTKFTGYLKGSLRGIKEVYGIEDLSLESFKKLTEKLKIRNQDTYEYLMQKYNIKAKIVDVVLYDDFIDIINGNKEYSKYSFFAFPLPDFHSQLYSIEKTYRLQSFLGRKIVCMDDYLEAFEILFKKAVEFGIVCIKDQSAYVRKIDFKQVSKSKAEESFNNIIANSYSVAGSEKIKDFSDYFFNHVLKLARKYNLPVQCHTGHMARIRDEIEKTNAIHLNEIINIHSDVKFDLFHGNWPYMDEFLFLGKNNANVYLDLCWAQSIDPQYSIDFMKRAVTSVPHKKIMAFGGDTNYIELAIGYLEIAKDSTAKALSDLVEINWINVNEAKEIALDWFYNNPVEFFNLRNKI